MGTLVNFFIKNV